MDLKSTELRIGNLVQVYHGKKIHIITSLDIDDINRGKFPVEGIPITEEWLLRSGFEVDKNVTYSSGHEKEYKVYRIGLFTFNGIQNAWWYNGQVLFIQPKYVHQLQNLYFALTGTELVLQERGSKV